MKDKTKVLKTYRDFVRQTAIYLPNWGGGVIGGGFLTRGSSRLEHLLIVTKRL